MRVFDLFGPGIDALGPVGDLRSAKLLPVITTLYAFMHLDLFEWACMIWFKQADMGDATTSYYVIRCFQNSSSLLITKTSHIVESPFPFITHSILEHFEHNSRDLNIIRFTCNIMPDKPSYAAVAAKPPSPTDETSGASGSGGIGAGAVEPPPPCEFLCFKHHRDDQVAV